MRTYLTDNAAWKGAFAGHDEHRKQQYLDGSQATLKSANGSTIALDGSRDALNSAHGLNPPTSLLWPSLTETNLGV
jgi:hypothetical protein